MRQFFFDVAIQPEVRFIAKQNSLMKIGNNGNLVLGPFDESTPCLMIVLMNCQTKLRINHLTAVKSVAILEIALSLSSLLNYLRAFGDGPVARVPGGQGIESWLACLEFQPSATKDPPCRAAMHLNLSRAEMSSRWCGVVVRRRGASSGVALVI
ncbi:alpha-2 adrenergic receptor [Trichonephila clavipes]|nr:alpha-2 adrenergic receptor [Trichonephila clavipes]